MKTAPSSALIEPGDDAQQRRLARPRRSEQRQELPGRHREVDAADAPGTRRTPCVTLRTSMLMAATLRRSAPRSRGGDALVRRLVRRSTIVCSTSVTTRDRAPAATPPRTTPGTRIRCRESRRESASSSSRRGCGPETTDTAPNSPMARAVHRITPLSSAHFTFGSVTRQKICQPLAPSSFAASSSSRPDASITAISSRATKGNDTKIVARTMPGSAKMILMSCSNSHGPNQPWRPKSCTKISPATTGETANGRSISVVSSRLPRKSNLVMAHAAARPNSVLAGRRSRRR